MNKTHFKVTLDVYAICHSGIASAERLAECGFIINPDQDATDEFIEVQDITIDDVVITDSR